MAPYLGEKDEKVEEEKSLPEGTVSCLWQGGDSCSSSHWPCWTWPWRPTPPPCCTGAAARRPLWRGQARRSAALQPVLSVNNTFSHLFKGPTKHQLLEYSKVHPVMVPKEFGRFRVGSGFTSFLSAGQQEGSVNCLSLQHSFRLKLIIASFIFLNKIVYKTPDFLMKVYFHKINSLRFSKPHLSQPSSRPAPPQPSPRTCASCSSQDMAHGTQGTLTPEGEGKVTIS